MKKLGGKISAVNIQDLTAFGKCEEYGKGVLPLDGFLGNSRSSTAGAS